MQFNLFNTLQNFDSGNGQDSQFHSLPALEKSGVGPIRDKLIDSKSI